MTPIHRFFFKYCTNGHMLYSEDVPVSRQKCSKCGEPYLDACEHCGSPIPNSFTSYKYLTSGQPMSFPQRPSFCGECGHQFPWEGAVQKKIEGTGAWELLHPIVVKIARPRFESGHYADAVEAALKALNSHVKKMYRESTGNELDGVSLMRKAFTPSNPTFALDDLGTETGKNIQQGYMDLFAGSISGIRNPKAHENIIITPERAIHHLFLASLLFSKLEETGWLYQRKA